MNNSTDSPSNEILSELKFKIERIFQVFWAVEITLGVIAVQRIAIGAWEQAIALFVAMLLLTSCYFVAKKGHLKFASTILLSTVTVLLTFFMWSFQGLRDEIMLAYPSVLILAAMIGSGRLFVGLFTFIIIVVFANGYVNETGIYVNQVNVADKNAALLVSLIIALISFSVWSLSADFRKVLRQLSREYLRVKESKAEIEKLMHHDALTGLPNRILAKTRFEQSMTYLDRNKQSMCVMFIDLDGFKSVNDAMGHQVGDTLLIELANRLQDVVRNSDTVCRLGGDEFLIIADFNNNEQYMSELAERVRQAVIKPIRVGDRDLVTSCSIGIAIAPQDGYDFNTIMKHADTAMYHAKDMGKNCFHFFDRHMNSNVQEHMQIVSDLRKALKNDEFVLYYQPQIDLTTSTVIGAEALIRWIHPEKGLIPPNLFIPHAESSGLIIDIGRWALDRAVCDCKNWQLQGFDLTVAVNISPKQFRRSDIQSVVQKALEIHGLEANQLELEITESLLVDDTQELNNTLKYLTNMGVKISIDDFGTGYSNLGYLKKLEVGTLKIDQSFIQKIQQDPQDQAIVTAIIQMASSLNLKTIAEGVEHETTKNLLAGLQCDQGQGYLWAKPLPNDEFLTFIRKRAEM
ncbi:putative bifunctional diguanylate cyclase/phosphodiesterase [Thalassotalea agarivorans]|uniref:cyclic-guanylate-specific phosphodiesterase n=1 Tax=Thalassotalea agarivorans TaxID=349064 RepID=A0A1I0FVP6_THASX|nr:EAL domain-containing protein [Thalassotalea agarivorans]SET62357.1 diguanylate cyclase (GGDEF) domain-containing protein [Thalassotalea agarivorans]